MFFKSVVFSSQAGFTKHYLLAALASSFWPQNANYGKRKKMLKTLFAEGAADFHIGKAKYRKKRFWVTPASLAS